MVNCAGPSSYRVFYAPLLRLQVLLCYTGTPSLLTSMRTINFTVTLLAVLSSCIYMISAIPVKDGALSWSISRRGSGVDYCRLNDTRSAVMCGFCNDNIEEQVCQDFCKELQQDGLTAPFCTSKSE